MPPVGVPVLRILCHPGGTAEDQHGFRVLLLRRLGASDASREDEFAVEDPHLMRRHTSHGIHRRWRPLIRRDVRAGLWLHAVVAIEADVDADTPLMGIDQRLGDGAAVKRSVRTRMLEVACSTSVTRGSAHGPPRVTHPVTAGPHSGAPPGWAWP